MTLVMAYVTLVAAGIAATAAVFEALVRGRGFASRWVWIVAIGLTSAATLYTMLVPKRATAIEATLAGSTVMAPAQAGVSMSAASSTPDVAFLLVKADLALPVAWLLASALLLVALGAGQRRYRRERTRAKAARVGGHDVLLTENVGPAVAGVRRPVVFVPRWVLALDDNSQQLLLSHELEHVRERDTWLLLFGAVSVAVTPWNPVVWWMVRRLRLAVEQDCDARVLARHPGIRRYADLLLTAASRHGLAARLLAAHFGEHTSDLVRRIEAMTNVTQLSWRRIGGAAIVAVAIMVVACETPRPDPVAPISLEKETPASTARSAEFAAMVQRCSPNGGEGCTIAVIVTASDGKELRRYDGEIPVADVPEGSIRNIKVENTACGSSECSLVWITLKPDASLATKTPLLADKVEAGAREERALVQRFREVRKDLSGQPPSLLERPIVGDSMVEVRKRDEEVAGIRGIMRDRLESVNAASGQPSRIVLRGTSAPADPPNVVIVTSDGVVLQRISGEAMKTAGRKAFDDIRPDDIESIEVLKGNSCGAQPMACPLVTVTIKPGREGAYTKR